MIGVTVLGSTGSVGTSTLDVLQRHPDRFFLVALTANRDVDRLYEQCLQHRPRYAVLADEDRAAQLRERLRIELPGTEVLSGISAVVEVAAAPQADYVMAAIVGAAGLAPALAAVRAGKRVLLANKEALVMAGRLFMDEVAAHGALLLPIDSEHNAIFQCLPADAFGRELQGTGIRRILLTASGGPFRETPLDELERVTPEQACAHPNWDMGRKISVDSASMMNKGLEVIEACWLFHAEASQIQVVLHPQSVIHSMVEYADGSVLAQLGNPDMRTPIAHALGWPERIESGVASLDLFATARLDFSPPQAERFPCLGLAYQAIEAGGTCPAILNAANEVAVEAFLGGRLTFTGIPRLVREVLDSVPGTMALDLESIFESDHKAREAAEHRLRQGRN